jgi:hypothetical protein
MRHPVRFSYTERDIAFGEFSSMPYLPVRLTTRVQSVDAMALLDTGASVNVLPYHLGLLLGFDWDRQTTKLRLSGNLAGTEAKALVLDVTVGSFSPILLAFAWTRTDASPLIFGQVNFFQEFDVCFYRSQEAFEVAPRVIG